MVNGGNIEVENRFAQEVTAVLGHWGTGGSDAHSTQGLAKGTTVFRGDIRNERDLLDAVAAGATGYLVKSTAPEELREALWRAAQGEPVFSPALAGLVLGEFRRLSKDAGGLQPLSEREREVLQYVARGHSYKEIGEELFISPKTVENHVRNILGKLHLNRKQELVRYALEHGIE